MRRNRRTKISNTRKVLPIYVLWGGLLLGIFIIYKTLFCFAEPRCFPIKHIRLVGTLQRIAPTEVKKVMQPHLKGFFSTNVMYLKQDVIGKVPFVAEANVKRIWPDTLLVTLVEQNLIALWGDHAGVSSKGDIIFLSDADHPKLPLFIGPEDQTRNMVEQYNELSKLLAPLNLRIAQLSLNSRRSLQVELTNGMKLILGRKDIEQSLLKLSAILPKLQKRHGSTLEAIDFRHTNGVCVHIK